MPKLAICKIFVGLFAAAVLSACGGGGGGGGDEPKNSVATEALVTPATPGSSTSYVVAANTIPEKPATRQEAARFLTQATFGPTDKAITRLMAIGYKAWLDEQFTLPMSTVSHQSYWQTRNGAIKAANPARGAGGAEVMHSFWNQALTGNDQLRQRVAFALSEIFVVSLMDNCGSDGNAVGIAAYLDMLGKQSFGTYRSLIEKVALNPIMGCYLSHIRNQKEDLASGRVPDENFARELLQLFSIGLYQLNQDGSLKLDANGQPIETYNESDISGLAKVFTGWSWQCPDMTEHCFMAGRRQSDMYESPDRYTGALKAYPLYHSTSEKRFLNVVIPRQSTPNPQASLTTALDTLAAHQNLAPFLSKQLIQRMVTSNPSPAYINRVSMAFRASGGDMKAMISAVLLDHEARDWAPGNAQSTTFGKIKEPILRLSNVIRAMGAQSATGSYLIGIMGDPGFSIGQFPLYSPSVFNFFRPGYVAPGSSSGAASMVAPELQLVNETTVAGYAGVMRRLMTDGIGNYGYDGTTGKSDVQLTFNSDTQFPLRASATNDLPGMVEVLNQWLLYGTMSSDLRAAIIEAVTAVDLRRGSSPTATQINDTQLARLRAAVLLIAVSPEFQIQK